ncbi:MAG: hypothetical protein AB7L94_25565 [Kofleriaceae bacterium]
MPTPKLTSLDLTVLFGVTGGKSRAAQLELTAALDRLKSGIADLARNDAPNDALPLAILFSLSRRRGGGGGAPAELGLPQAPSAAPAAIKAGPSTQYAQA